VEKQIRKQFESVPIANVGRSVFNLSHDVKMTCEMGYLVPILAEEMVPGDKWDIGNEIVIRLQPLMAPVLHEINCYVHYFFVPYRLLWDDWEDFITGGRLGTDASVLPRWHPADTAVGSLWDYLGMPTGVDCDGSEPMDFPKRAYNMIYNDYYRDETQIAEIDITTSEALKKRAWPKDYFTAALPWQTRGTAPALPLTGTQKALLWTEPVHDDNMILDQIYGTASAGYDDIRSADGAEVNMAAAYAAVDFANAGTFDVADLRLAFALQKWMERNALAGARYPEFLASHFGVFPKDERLQRPEYLGGSKSPIIVSEVMQTSSTDATTPQGNLAGHGLTSDRNYICSYRAEEFGCVIGIMSIMPKAAYQQGVNRQWLRSSKYDFFFPEFQHLSEQAITRAEIYANSTAADNATVFGYIGRYDEMRVKQSRVAGLMRTTLDHWHMGIQYGAAPSLNQAFIECTPRIDCFAVQDEDTCIVNVANIIRAIRPIPIESDPQGVV